MPGTKGTLGSVFTPPPTSKAQECPNLSGCPTSPQSIVPVFKARGTTETTHSVWTTWSSDDAVSSCNDFKREVAEPRSWVARQGESDCSWEIACFTLMLPGYLCNSSSCAAAGPDANWLQTAAEEHFNHGSTRTQCWVRTGTNITCRGALIVKRFCVDCWGRSAWKVADENNSSDCVCFIFPSLPRSAICWSQK